MFYVLETWCFSALHLNSLASSVMCGKVNTVARSWKALILAEYRMGVSEKASKEDRLQRCVCVKNQTNKKLTFKKGWSFDHSVTAAVMTFLTSTATPQVP